MKRQASAGELQPAEFLRFTSAIRTSYPENDQVNARWYPAPGNPHSQKEKSQAGPHRHAAVERRRLLPQRPLHLVRTASASPPSASPSPTTTFAAPPSSNAPTSPSPPTSVAPSHACRQAVVDIRCCIDWLQHPGLRPTSASSAPALGSCLRLHRRRARPPPARLRLQSRLHLVRRRRLDRTVHPPHPLRPRNRPASPRTSSARYSLASARWPTCSGSPPTPGVSSSFTPSTT